MLVRLTLAAGLLLSQALLAHASNPILVVGTSADPFSYYYTEILLAEGQNSFDKADISTVSAALLANYDLVILGNMPLNSVQVTTLETWVNGGGNLIAMRPDQQLAGLFGLTPASSTLSNAYLLVDTSVKPGLGIVNQPIQFHGTADLYTLSGATAVATLYSNPSTPTANPAVTLRYAGSNGGKAAAFTYDLARSVVYTRQGNPAWAGEERDGIVPIRSDDLYFGPALSDPEPNWNDLNNIAIPQADEQQRLLTNLMLLMNQTQKPLPRFWYFPLGKQAVVIMTGDDHGGGATSSRFDIFLNMSSTGCSVANWECVRSTSYVYPGVPLTDAQAAAYVAQGFEVALHVQTQCLDYTPLTLPGFYDQQLAEWVAQFPSVPLPTTNRTHCAAWSDWSTQPAVEIAHNIRFDTTYYDYGPGSWALPNPGMFTGSGMPMHFANLDGSLTSVYQATTYIADDNPFQAYPTWPNTLLDNAVGPLGFYGAFTCNFHNDCSGCSDEEGAIQTVMSAQAHGVPVISSQQMLQWLDGRNSSTFSSFTWDGSTLTFTVFAGSGANGLQGMVPVNFAGESLTGIKLNGSSVAYTTQTIKGEQYAFFNASSGVYQAVYGGSVVVSVAPPTVTLGPSQTQQFSATVTGTGSTGVSWSLAPAVGTLTSEGLYTGPATVSSSQNITVTATSIAQPAASGSAVVTLVADTPPVISGILAVPSSASVTISWTTDKAASSRVDYGTSSNSLYLTAQDGTLVTSHNITVTGLAEATTYYYRVSSTDAANNTSTSPPVSSAPLSAVTVDTIPPAISAVSVQPGNNSATLTWTTNELSNSRVDYGLSASSLNLNALDSSMVGSHSITLTGLATNTTYYYRVSSTDAGGNVTSVPPLSSAPASFMTDDGLPPVISAVTATAGLSNTALITWTTDEPSTSRVDYGTSQTSLNLYIADPSVTISHSISLPGLTQGATYYFRVTSADAAGNSSTFPVTSNSPSSFAETATSIFGPISAPAEIDSTDFNPIELGVKFRSDVAGFVTGVRFFKALTNTGTHLGHLWSSTGTLLATVTFSNESPSGWQQANFPSPVPINANTTYIISYYAPVAHYSDNAEAFYTSGVDNPPLHALQSGVDGGNGIYQYGPSTFPTSTYNATNYWVDLIFTPNSGNANPPVIANVAAVPATNSATVTWTTNIPADSRVDYGTSPTSLNANVSNSTLVTSHSITLSGLTGATVYYFRVTSSASGSSATSPAPPNSPATFTTGSANPPVISNVAAVPATNSATVTWSTDIPADSQVNYGTSPTSLNVNVSNPTLVTSHSITLSGLTSATVYYFRVTSSASGSSATSPAPSNSPAAFTTGSANPPMISAVAATPGISGTAAITWTTDTASNSRVDYGTSSSSLNANASNPSMATSHSITLSGLTTGTTYYYRVTSTDSFGNSATFPPLSSSPNSFVESGPITIWPPSTTPAYIDSGDPGAVELGVKFRSDVAGSVTGVRFYKAAANIGTHLGNLWTSNGTLLASATFANETASGWQQATFTAPVPINAGTTYIVSYYAPAGHYSVNEYYFQTATDAPPLHALANGTDGGNGVYAYGTSAFPSGTFNLSNYWVDLTFIPVQGPVISSVTATPGSTSATLAWSTDVASSSRVDYGISPSSLNLNASNASLVTSHSISLTGLTAGITYYFRVTSVDSSGNSSTSPVLSNAPASFFTDNGNPPVISAVAASPGSGGSATITWTTDKPSSSGVDYGTSSSSLNSNTSDPTLLTSHSITLSGLTAGTTYYYRVTSVDSFGRSTTSPPLTSDPDNFLENVPVSIWPASTIPAGIDSQDPSAVELGVKFRSDIAGSIIGVRFYKAVTNIGTHVGHLWSGSGTLLATVTFSGETASGWQQANFAAPVPISANTTYIISYFAPAGHYSANPGYFTSSGADNASLHALQSGVDGPNGVYLYGSDAFPTFSYDDNNYWVDVLFTSP